MSENPTGEFLSIPSQYRYDYYDWRYLVTVIIAILSIQVFTVAMVIVIWEVLK